MTHVADNSEQVSSPTSLASRPSPILFLHGAWHGAWCWTDVVAKLATRGHIALALDLPGGGLLGDEPQLSTEGDLEELAVAVSAFASMDMDTYVADTAAAVEALAQQYGPVTLVGHSLAGLVLHRLGEMLPDRILRLVYLAAIAPRPGETAWDDITQSDAAGSLFEGLPVGDPAVTGALRINCRSRDAAYIEQARKCFYGDVSPEKMRNALAMLNSDAPAMLYGVRAELSLESWGRIPRTWIVTTRDMARPPAAQLRCLRELDEAFPDNKFDVLEIESSHSPFLSMPDAFADMIASIETV